MVRRNVLLIACLVVLAALFVVGCGGETQTTTTAAAPATTAAPTETTAAPTETTAAPQEATVIKLRFAAESAPGHMFLKYNYPSYWDLVEKATNGKYKFDIEMFPVNTILAPPDIYDGIVQGVVDAGSSSMAFTPKRFPLMLTLSQPGVAPPDSVAAMSKAANELYLKYNPKELEDTHLLYCYATGPGSIHSKKKITTLDDLKGARIRVSGTGAPGVKAVGGDGIAMPMAEAFEAAQKGTIDALLSPQETLENWKHAELFDYSIFSPMLYASDIFFVTMNKSFWESLPEDLRTVMDSLTVEAGILAGRIGDWGAASGLEFAIKTKGKHEMSQWSDADKAKMAELLAPIRATHIKNLNDLGLAGEEIVAAATALVSDASKEKFEPWKPTE